MKWNSMLVAGLLLIGNANSAAADSALPWISLPQGPPTPLTAEWNGHEILRLELDGTLTADWDEIGKMCASTAFWDNASSTICLFKAVHDGQLK